MLSYFWSLASRISAISTFRKLVMVTLWLFVSLNMLTTHNTSDNTSQTYTYFYWECLTWDWGLLYKDKTFGMKCTYNVWLPFSISTFSTQPSGHTRPTCQYADLQNAVMVRDGIFKLLRSPGIDFKESNPPAYVACRACICKPYKKPRNRFPAWRNRSLGIDSQAP
jgi:hypothetical protein